MFASSRYVARLRPYPSPITITSRTQPVYHRRSRGRTINLRKTKGACVQSDQKQLTFGQGNYATDAEGEEEDE